MRRCEKMRRCFTDPHYWKNPALRRSREKPMASLSLIPFPFALHSLSSSSLAVTHGNTTNENKDERCHILTLHRFTRFHLEPRMRNIPKTVSILLLFLLPQTRSKETNVDTFKLQQLSSHCISDYFGSTKIVGSNSFGQNKIGHEFCLPKTDSSKFTLYKPTYFVRTCYLYEGIFFSVLRLCGSRQVVAPCRADERITQMHSLYPSLGVQKWSKITTKWCQFQNEKPTKTQQKTNTHNPHPKTTPNKNKTQKGTWHDGSKKQWHQVLLN